MDDAKDVASILRQSCVGCQMCVSVCEPIADAISAERMKVVVDPALCVGCGLCIPICPVQAISMVRVGRE